MRGLSSLSITMILNTLRSLGKRKMEYRRAQPLKYILHRIQVDVTEILGDGRMMFPIDMNLGVVTCCGDVAIMWTMSRMTPSSGFLRIHTF